MPAVKFIDCDEVYYWYCDCCENDDCGPMVIWPDKNFALCLTCLKRLALENHLFNPGPLAKISRITIKEATRNKIYDRDGRKCQICGATEKLTIDHILPFSAGGKTEEPNLQTLCKKCNLAKRDKYRESGVE